MILGSQTITENPSGSNVKVAGKKSQYLEVTFQPNKNAGIHRWYPYVEGFSGDFVSRMLNEFSVELVPSIVES